MTSCNHHSICASCGSFSSSCPYPQWMHPIYCNPTHYCDAGLEYGPTLVIHQIALEPSGSQSCAPRAFSLRITGPSYPCGETFTLRAGSCTELDEPLVISGLTPGEYTIELLGTGACAYDTTITGPVCGNTVVITASAAPTVVTLVCRRRYVSRCGCQVCGCAGCSQSHHSCGQASHHDCGPSHHGCRRLY